MNLATILLFTYNRLEHTKSTIVALQNNQLAKDSVLIIYSDAPKNSDSKVYVEEVRDYIKTVDGFSTVKIVEREENFGLSRSIIDGVSTALDEYGKAIVLEDDLITSPYFLQYMNDGLDMYEYDDSVASIHGYVYPIDSTVLPETFFIKGADCWGWATWKRAWECFEADGKRLLSELESRRLTHSFDFDGSYDYTKMLKGQIAGRNNSWAVRWYASAYLRDMLTLYPSRSLVRNIGQDCSGTHSGYGTFFDGELCMERVLVQRQEIAEYSIGRDRFVVYLASVKRSLATKVINKLRYYAVRITRRFGL